MVVVDGLWFVTLKHNLRVMGISIALSGGGWKVVWVVVKHELRELRGLWLDLVWRGELEWATR